MTSPSEQPPIGPVGYPVPEGENPYRDLPVVPILPTQFGDPEGMFFLNGAWQPTPQMPGNAPDYTRLIVTQEAAPEAAAPAGAQRTTVLEWMRRRAGLTVAGIGLVVLGAGGELHHYGSDAMQAADHAYVDAQHSVGNTADVQKAHDTASKNGYSLEQDGTLLEEIAAGTLVLSGLVGGVRMARNRRNNPAKFGPDGKKIPRKVRREKINAEKRRTKLATKQAKALTKAEAAAARVGRTLTEVAPRTPAENTEE